MTRKDRMTLSILIVLILVLGLTIFFVYRSSRPASVAAVPAPAQKLSTNPPTPTDARIRLDMIEKPPAPGTVGRRNVFQYRETAAGTQDSEPGSTSQPQQTDQHGPTPAAGPPPPPPPPPIPFKYEGFAVEAGQTLTAFISDDSSQHYNVTVGEILMGRYRIAQISQKSIEIEDLQNDRRQTFSLVN